ncbi:MAG TPA: hypothetical protein VF596_02860, partial [Pyrinomonadaceae bacterium]
MKKKSTNTTAIRSFVLMTAALGMLLFISVTPSFGQGDPPIKTKDVETRRSETVEGLIDTGFMTTPDISDDLDGSDDEYFYKVLAGPGKLTVTMEVVANGTNAGAYLDLFGPNSKAILSNMLVQGIDGGSDKVTKSVNIAKKQIIVIRIKGIKYG